jgi:hypothetical protein
MMNKDVSELFRNIGENFLVLSEIYSSVPKPAPVPKTKKTSEKDDSNAQKTAIEEAVQNEEKPVTYTKEDVRAMLAQKAKEDGCKYKADVKALVAKYSSDGTLTNVSADNYLALMAELEVLGNA